MDEHSEILKKLYSLQKVGIKLGLERTYKLFEKLENPQNNLKFIHIAGTNGKGSVCATVAKALEKAGYKVGFYSSPHLISLRERFRINGKGISWNELESLVEEVWPTVLGMRNNEEYVTFFEVTVALAVKYFENNNCDFVLWETGLGGRLDSTNIVTPIITAITGIGLDHEAYLGNTEEKIAAEKAGIIKENIPIFVGKMNTEAANVIKKTANNKCAAHFSVKDNSDIVFKRKIIKEELLSGWEFYLKSMPEDKYFLPLPGNVQPQNLKLSYLILKYMSEKYSFPLKKALKGIADLKWPGRIQLLPDGKILDGAHNPQGIQEFIDTVTECYPKQKFKIIFGCLIERNPYNALKLLSAIAEEFIFVSINSVRPCFPPEDAAGIAKKAAPNIPVRIEHSSKSALEYCEDAKTVIIGSFYLAGEILKSYYDINKIVNI